MQRLLCLALLCLGELPSVEAFISSSNRRHSYESTLLRASKLPPGISPFDKKHSSPTAITDALCKIAAAAVTKAAQDNSGGTFEIEFPALINSKTQFDDFDNLSELDANRDWCLQLASALRSQSSLGNRQLWLVLPDDKEAELASRASGKRPSALFTSIRAACEAINTQDKMILPWGSNLASAVNKLTGGDGIVGDSSCLDELDPMQKRLQLVCQPGNGGPVEDWINVEALHKASNDLAVTVVVNGALDKVCNGFYPALFFPALAKSVPFYKQFDAALYLKPVSDKGVYGWIYRVYPEPWQVILQTPIKNADGQVIKVNEQVAMTSDSKPSYTQAVQALVKEALKLS